MAREKKNTVASRGLDRPRTPTRSTKPSASTSHMRSSAASPARAIGRSQLARRGFSTQPYVQPSHKDVIKKAYAAGKAPPPAVYPDTKVICAGITGKTGAFHVKGGIDYGSNYVRRVPRSPSDAQLLSPHARSLPHRKSHVTYAPGVGRLSLRVRGQAPALSAPTRSPSRAGQVGGSHPKKGGTKTDMDAQGFELPLYTTMAEAKKETDCDAAVLFVRSTPPPFPRRAAPPRTTPSPLPPLPPTPLSCCPPPLPPPLPPHGRCLRPVRRAPSWRPSRPRSRW